MSIPTSILSRDSLTSVSFSKVQKPPILGICNILNKVELSIIPGI